MKIKLLLGGVCLSATMMMPAYALDNDCEQLVYDHGLASAAQFSCGFEFYNDNIITRAKQCRTQAVNEGIEEDFMILLRKGFDDFKESYKEINSQYRLCKDFAEQYPSFVQP